MALKKDTSGDGVPLVTAVQRLFDLTVVESVEDPGADAPVAAAAASAPAAAPAPHAVDDGLAALPNQKKASGS